MTKQRIIGSKPHRHIKHLTQLSGILAGFAERMYILPLDEENLDVMAHYADSATASKRQALQLFSKLPF